MKRILLVLCVIFGMQSYAQICTPDTAVPSLGPLGYPSLEWSGMWVNGETPSFACDSTQPMMNLAAVVGQPFEATLTGMLGDTFHREDCSYKPFNLPFCTPRPFLPG